ncbi:MAG: hypothetical protein JWO03_1426, partial [Bacteroidetes bacterium]|nr:hypothetical protein [Bacteroidota bacterium]
MIEDFRKPRNLIMSLPLHNLMDDLLIILFDNTKIDLNVVYRDRYYKYISYEYLSSAVSHLISEGLVYSEEDATISITAKGIIFIKDGGYEAKIGGEIEDVLKKRIDDGLDPTIKIDRKTYLSYMNYPDKLPEIKQNGVMDICVVFWKMYY